MGESRLCVRQGVGLCRTSYDSHPAGSQPPPPRGIFEVFHSTVTRTPSNRLARKQPPLGKVAGHNRLGIHPLKLPWGRGVEVVPQFFQPPLAPRRGCGIPAKAPGTESRSIKSPPLFPRHAWTRQA